MDFFAYICCVWFAFYMVNYSLIFEKLRKAAMPALPKWLQTLLQCAICFTFWITAALSLFAGFSAVIFAAPPCALFVDLAYRKLGGHTGEDDNAQPPILK